MYLFRVTPQFYTDAVQESKTREILLVLKLLCLNSRQRYRERRFCQHKGAVFSASGAEKKQRTWQPARCSRLRLIRRTVEMEEKTLERRRWRVFFHERLKGQRGSEGQRGERRRGNRSQSVRSLSTSINRRGFSFGESRSGDKKLSKAEDGKAHQWQGTAQLQRVPFLYLFGRVLKAPHKDDHCPEAVFEDGGKRRRTDT